MSANPDNSATVEAELPVAPKTCGPTAVALVGSEDGPPHSWLALAVTLTQRSPAGRSLRVNWLALGSFTSVPQIKLFEEGPY